MSQVNDQDVTNGKQKCWQICQNQLWGEVHVEMPWTMEVVTVPE